MPNTPVQALPYPALTDPANGPVAVQNLATALEDYKTIIRCTSTTRPAHVEGRVIYETDTDRLMVSDGAAWNGVVRDTGLRDITSFADAGWKTAFPASKVFARRIGNTVYVIVGMRNGTGGPSVTVMSNATAVFPQGFRQPSVLMASPDRRQAVGFTFNNSNGTIGGAQLIVFNDTFATDLALYGMTTGTQCTAQIVFTTDEPFPTVLPGIAATG